MCLKYNIVCCLVIIVFTVFGIFCVAFFTIPRVIQPQIMIILFEIAHTRFEHKSFSIPQRLKCNEIDENWVEALS